MVTAGIKVPGDGRFNPSSSTSCFKCSERNGLNFAWANGRPIFLCGRHYRDWMKEGVRDPEMTRQIPFKQVKGINDSADPIPNQDKRVF